MRPLVIVSYPSGPRCWVLGQRIHHGSIGVLLIGIGLTVSSRTLSAAGLMLVAHDRADRGIWFSREGLDRPLSTV